MRSRSNFGNSKQLFFRKMRVIAFTITLGGFIAIPYASADTIKVSLLENGKVVNPKTIANDFEIGSTLIMKVTRIETSDSDLGSFSREDGSMAGAYGDGEFAN